MNGLTAGIFAYVALQLGIGAWASRRIKTETDYLLAGRTLGYPLTIFTVFATWFGAETCMGASAEVFQHGLSGAVADPFGYAIAVLLMGALLAARLRKRELTTIADLFRTRYGAGTERLAALILVPTSVMWAGAQIRAFGQVLSSASGWSVTLAITAAALVVIGYTFLGGMLADAYTDFVQGGVLIFGLIALALAVWSAEGAFWMQLEPAVWDFRRTEEGWWAHADRWSVPILGSLVAQELISRALSARSPQVAARGTVAAAGMYFCLGLLPVGIALAARVSGRAVADPDQVLLDQAAHYLGPVWFAVFCGALVSAILSTVDSALLVAGSLSAKNVLEPLRPDISARGRVRLNRGLVAMFGVVAYALALSVDSVYELVEEASALGTSGVLVCLLFGLFSTFGGQRAAFTSLLTGVVVYGVANSTELTPAPYLASLFAAGVAYVAVAQSERVLTQGMPAQ